ncbi:MAG: sulfite exporter TauE/SafE family protein [Thermincola sp.]|nr:sulfite exporter TauE/SafE family protein [Thermincola sp.]MDT3704449.1 sulfite exporter TauE/SafE family protein [Thermincola sp.]
MVTILLLVTGFLAGIVGALLGLGGGVIIIPVLTILFKLPIQTAIGVSLAGVIATSTGAAMVYIREGKADIRLGMLLELATTVGAVTGAVAAGYVGSKALYLLFSALMFYTTYSMLRKNTQERVQPSRIQEEIAVGSAGVTKGHNFNHSAAKIKNIPGGLFFSGLAGIISGLLGIGGGVLKIPVMYLLMGIPLKTAAATSNFMVGVTACASAFVYFTRGHIDVLVAVPMALGVFAGAAAGTMIHAQVPARILKQIFIIIFIFVAVEMGLKGLAL